MNSLVAVVLLFLLFWLFIGVEADEERSEHDALSN